jgi:hypothetical protein
MHKFVPSYRPIFFLILITFIILFPIHIFTTPSGADNTLKIDHTAQSGPGFQASINLKGKFAYAEFQDVDKGGYAIMEANITIDDWGAESSVDITLEAYGVSCTTEINPNNIHFTRLSHQSVDFRVQVAIPRVTTAEEEFRINVTGVAWLPSNVRNVNLKSKIFHAKMETFHNFILEYHPSNISMTRDQTYKIEPTILNLENHLDNYRLEVMVDPEDKNDPDISFELERNYFEIPAFIADNSYIRIVIGKEAEPGEYDIILRVTGNYTDSNKKKSLSQKEEIIKVTIFEPKEYKRESGMFTVLMIGFIISVVILTSLFLIIRTLVGWIHKRIKQD